jgi:uncharacterized repeat protein (TIGR02543 family)
MKKIFLLFATIIMVLLTSCSEMFNSYQIIADNKCGLRLSTSLNRSIQPDSQFSRTDIDEYTLSGIHTDIGGQTAVAIATWKTTTENETTTYAYDKMVADDTLYVDSGSWTFTLTALYKDVVVAKGSVTNITIVEGTNSLSFALEEPEDAVGSMGVTLYWPQTETVDSVYAGLYTLTGKAVSGYTEEALSVSAGTNTYAGYIGASYVKENVPVGTYLVHFTFYRNGSSVMNNWEETVCITASRSSTAVRSFESLNSIFIITYDMNAGDDTTAGWADGYTPTSSFIRNQKMAITLPTMGKAVREKYYFLGWYTDSACSDGNEVAEIAAGTACNKTVYAKWGAAPYEDKTNYIVYGNGMRLVVASGIDADRTTVYFDIDKNGAVSDGDLTLHALNNNYPEDSSDLSAYTVVADGQPIVMCGGKIGSLYGGSYNAALNVTENKISKEGESEVYGTSVSMTGGTITGIIAGGSYRSDSLDSTADTTLIGNTNLSINLGTIFGTVYGGSYNAAQTGNTSVTLYNTNVTGSVFGGSYKGTLTGNTVIANVTYGTYTNIYGGSNEGTITGTVTETINGGVTITNLYGGSFNGSCGAVTVNAPMSWGTVTNLYAGGSGTATAAGVTTNISTGGTIVSIDGGKGNLSGTGTTATLNISGTPYKIGDGNTNGIALSSLSGGSVTVSAQLLCKASAITLLASALTANTVVATSSDSSYFTAGQFLLMSNGDKQKISKSDANIVIVTYPLQSIYVYSAPTTTSYAQGTEFNAAGLVVKATYADGSVNTIVNGSIPDSVTMTGFDSSVVTANQIVTLSYTNDGTTKKTTFSVAITDAELTDVTITTEPTKKEYYIGAGGIELAGMVLTANYTNGTTKDVTKDAVPHDFDSSKAATDQIITVTYTENESTYSATYTVNIVRAPLTSIAVTTSPKTTYRVGDTFSSSGMVVTATYADGKTKTATSWTTSGFDSTSATLNQSITVSYTDVETVTTTYTVNIIKLTGIEITTNPTTTTYKVGGTLSTTGMVIKATYSDSSTTTVSSGYTTSGFDSTTAGTKIVTVSYIDHETATATFSVKIVALTSIAITTPPTKTEYTKGAELSTTGMVVKATYGSSDITETLASTAYTTSGFDSSTPGTQTITVSYTDNGVTKTTTFTVAVLCTVTFDANGGSGTSYTQTFTKGVAQSLTARTFYRLGYAFLGWATLNSATTATYTDKQSFTTDINMTLYAVWAQENPSVGMIFYPDGYSSDYISSLTPIGIVCEVSGPLVKKIMSLTSQNCVWAPKSSTGYSMTFNTSLTDGSSNWSIIASTDSTGALNAETNYPAFYYANNYSVGGITNWYIPARDEFTLLIDNNASAITAGLAKIPSSLITTMTERDLFWSSSSSSDESAAYADYFQDTNDNTSNWRYCGWNVRLIHVVN